MAQSASKAEVIKAQKVFKIDFEHDLVEVHSPKVQIETTELPSKASLFADARIRVLKSLESCLAGINDQLLLAASRAPEIALEVARNVLESSELLEERTQHFARLALDQARADAVELHVHPSCTEYLEGIVESATGPVRILPSPELKPGDCRVTYDGLGVEAKLDNFLAAASTELRKQGASA